MSETYYGQNSEALKKVKEETGVKKHKNYKELLEDAIKRDKAYAVFKSGFSFDGSGLRKNRNGKRVKNGDIEI